MIRERPVAARARRIAVIPASVPELTRRTLRAIGMAAAIRSAIATSSSVGSAVTEAEGGLLGDGGDDLGMGMAEDRGTIGSDVVVEAIAVGVDHHRAFAAGDEERRAADRFPCADRRVNGARDHGGGADEECGRIFLFDHLRVCFCFAR